MNPYAVYSLLILLGGLIGAIITRAFLSGRAVGSFEEQLESKASLAKVAELKSEIDTLQTAFQYTAPLAKVTELEEKLRSAQKAYQYECRARQQDIEDFSKALSIQGNKFDKHVEDYNKFLVRAALKGINGG
jgi:hypothetical protein